MSENEYWFCLTHHTVEGRDGCKNSDRLGPYASSAEAARALEKVEERNEEWDNDPKWNDDGARLRRRGHRRHAGQLITSSCSSCP